MRVKLTLFSSILNSFITALIFFLIIFPFRRLKIEKEKEKERKEERLSEFPETTVISTATPERHESSVSPQVSNLSSSIDCVFVSYTYYRLL